MLNLSLGGSGNCSALYTDIVGQVAARGAVIVASAGNGAGHAVSEPANCDGVIGVAGLRHAGSKVGYSDIGPEVSISAPAGNCVNTGLTDPCLYPILTTSNSGAFNPVAELRAARSTPMPSTPHWAPASRHRWSPAPRR